jgi:branched-chain amino acid transport system permease protein
MVGEQERRARPAWMPYLVPGAIALLLVALPALVDAFLPSFYLPLATEMLIFGLFALSYDIIMGYTGMVSFGHAAFFGLGAYITGLTMVRLGLPLLPALLLGVLGATAAAAAIGFFSLRLRSVYFALLTFAFSQIFYQLVITFTDLTGGYDGRALSVPMLWGIPDVLALNLRDRPTLYYFVLAVVVLTFLVMRRVMAAPFGQVLVAIRENELRAATLGYPVARYKQVAFVLSGLIGGLAGSLMVPYQRFISPDLLYWELSGLVIVMVLLGGMGTLWGPVLGAALVVFLRDAFSGLPQPYGKHYLLPVGLIFALLVIFAPNGIAGLLRRRAPRLAGGAPERGELAARPATDPRAADPRG